MIRTESKNFKTKDVKFIKYHPLLHIVIICFKYGKSYCYFDLNDKINNLNLINNFNVRFLNWIN